jgi:transposase-like protein
MPKELQGNYKYFETVLTLKFPRLKPETKAAFMCVLNGMPVKQVAAQYGLSYQALYLMRTKYFKGQAAVAKAKELLNEN